MVVEAKEKTSDQVERIKLTVDGQEIEVTKDEAIQLAQQGKHYTQEMQRLRDAEKTLEAGKARVAGLESIVDEMEGNPQLKAALNKVYSDFKSGKTTKSEENKDSSLKKIDHLINNAETPAEREQLRTIREIIQQEAPVEDIKKLTETISRLEQELSLIKNTAIIGHSEKVESELKQLEEKFGIDLVSKYKNDIKAMALKYPNQKMNKLLYHFADDSEIETTLLNQGKKKEKEELERKKRGSSPGGSEPSFVAKTPLEKDKRSGRTTFESIKQRVLERMGKA